MAGTRGRARLVAAAVALALVAGGAWLLVRRAPRAVPPRSGVAAALPSEERGTAELAAAEALAAPAMLDTPDAGPPTRESAAPDVPHGPVRGRLVDADDGTWVEGERLVLLATPGDRIAESVRSRDDGTFVSTRRFPRGPLRAFVTMPVSGERLGKHVAEFDPEAAGEWLVPVDRPARPAVAQKPPPDESETSLRGRVVDLERHSVADVQVRLLPVGEAGALRIDSTGGDGGFELGPLAPGAYRLQVLGRFARSQPHELVVLEGPNEAGDVVLPLPPIGGSLSGRLHLGERDESLYMLLLRDLATGKEVATSSEWKLFGEDAADGIVGFEIADVPVGEYELSVVALDGLAFEPRAMRVSPPEGELEFRAVGPSPPRIRLLVRDAESGRPIEDAAFLFRIHDQWVGGWGSPADGFEPVGAWHPWIVYSDEYRPERFGLERARRVPCDDDGECYEIEVALRRGFGAAVICKDLESDRLVVPEQDELPVIAPGLAGVRVLADGAQVATSDGDGLALVDLPRKPRTLTFERPGWRVVGDELEEGIRWVFLASE